MPGRLGRKQLEQLVQKGDVATVLTVFPDTFGRLMGKRVVGSYFLDHVVDDGAHACIYLFTVDMEMEPLPGFKLTSWERGYGDMKMVPDLTTARLIPWLPKTALVFCDVFTEEGEPIEEAPRRILKRQIERAAALGYVVKTAAELELYCFKESFDEARRKRHHDLTPVSSYLEDYHILQTSKEEPLIRAIRNDMAAAGSSFHLHSSLWDRAGRKPLFAAAGRGAKTSSTPLFGQWLAGQMAMARELAYFYAPGVNSYKRYQSGSFAPTRIVAGWDNRTCGFRLCGEGASFRVENRIPGADAHPYLAFAATIAAGLHGIA